MVYRYYFYMRLKQRNPHMTFCELMHWTWRWSFLGPPPEPDNTTSTRSVSKVRSMLTSSRRQHNSSMGDSMRDSSRLWQVPQSWRIGSLTASNQSETSSQLQSGGIESSAIGPSSTSMIQSSAVDQYDDYNNANYLDDDLVDDNEVESWDTFDSTELP